MHKSFELNRNTGITITGLNPIMSPSDIFKTADGFECYTTGIFSQLLIRTFHWHLHIVTTIDNQSIVELPQNGTRFVVVTFNEEDNEEHHIFETNLQAKGFIEQYMQIKTTNTIKGI